MRSSSRFGGALLDHLVEDGVDLPAGHVDHPPPLLHAVRGRPDDPVLQREELREARDRQPEDLQEDGGRQGLGDGVVEVAAAVGGDGADELLHECARLRLEQGDLLGCEQRVEQLAERLVLRRVDLEGDQWADLADRDRVEARRVDVGVLQHLAHLGFATDDDHAPVLHLEERATVAQQREQRLRVGEGLRVDIVGHVEQAHSASPI